MPSCLSLLRCNLEPQDPLSSSAFASKESHGLCRNGEFGVDVSCCPLPFRWWPHNVPERTFLGDLSSLPLSKGLSSVWWLSRGSQHSDLHSLAGVDPRWQQKGSGPWDLLGAPESLVASDFLCQKPAGGGRDSGEGRRLRIRMEEV